MESCFIYVLILIFRYVDDKEFLLSDDGNALHQSFELDAVNVVADLVAAINDLETTGNSAGDERITSKVLFDPDKIKNFNLFSWFGKWYNYVVTAIVIICLVVLCVILRNSAKCFIFFRQLIQRCRNCEQEDVEMGSMIDADDVQYEREEEVGTS